MIDRAYFITFLMYNVKKLEMVLSQYSNCKDFLCGVMTLNS